MPKAAAASRGRSDHAIAGNDGLGKPTGKTPITKTPLAVRLKTIDKAIAVTTAIKMPGMRGAHF